ncbi:MAG: ATP-binding protein, partial [Planctomycetota bacterium]
QQADAANVAKSQFLANMSHEIRTPLNALIGLAEIIGHDPLNDEQREHLALLRGAGDNLLRLINDILDLSKIEANELALDCHPFDLTTMINEVVALYRNDTRAEQLTLVAHTNLPETIVGDPTRLRQIISNLLGNAVKFTERGTVSVSAEIRSQSLYCAVHDSGIGLTSEQQQRIFAPFTQADAATTRQYGGTGLGLNICHQLIELMGGEIGVDSQLGSGATFWFTLPLAADSEAQTDTAREKPAPESALEHTLPEHLDVLLVEDNPVNQKVAGALLSHHGHHTTCADNGQHCLDLLAQREQPYDVILMDCQMPVLDGYQASQAIRALPLPHAATPIIALTANALDDDRNRCLLAGMDDYVAKPITWQLLHAVLLRVLGTPPLQLDSADS